MGFGRRRRFNGRRKRRVRTRRFIKKIARVSKRVIRRMSEVKRCIISGSTTVQNTQQLVLITPNISQGIDKDQRIGNKVMFRFLTLKVQALGTNQTAAGTGVTQSTGRIVLLTSRTQGLTAANAIEEGISTTPNNQTISIPLRSENVFVIKDKQFILGGLGLSGSTNDSSVLNYPVSRMFNFNHKMMRNARYNDSTAVVPTNPEASIYLYMAGTTNTQNINYIYSGRLSYIDI